MAVVFVTSNQSLPLMCRKLLCCGSNGEGSTVGVLLMERGGGGRWQTSLLGRRRQSRSHVPPPPTVTTDGVIKGPL